MATPCGVSQKAHDRDATQLAGQTMLQFHRTWRVEAGGAEHEIMVEYAALLGWMSIFVDGTRVVRRWREWQSVWGGAVVCCDLGGRRIEARVTQPYGRQEYSFALRVDGALQPGSDDLPDGSAVKRKTLLALGGIAAPVAVITVLKQLR